MSKKILIGLIIVILIGVGVWLTVRPKPSEAPVLVSPELKMIEKKAAYGYSVQEDEVRAAWEAVAMIQKKLVRSPDFVYLFSSIGYDHEKLLAEIRNLLPGIKIYGGTSHAGVMTPDGYLGTSPRSVALLGIAVDEIIWGVAGANLNVLSSREAGRKAVSTAIRNAGKELTEKPAIVFITAAPGTEEEIIAGIEEITGKEVPIFGGSSGDNEITGEWRQFANERVYQNGLALAVAYTDLKVAFKYEAGYPIIGQKGFVTKAKGRVIYEIDGRPAAVVYNEWTRGNFDKQVKEKPGRVWGILLESTLFPLAKVLRKPGTEPFYLAVHPLSIESDLSLKVFADVKEGDEIVLLEGDWDILLDRFRSTSEKALRDFGIKKGEAIFALYTYCAGNKLAIPAEERPKMSLLLNEAIGPVPYVATFTFGEQGFVPGIGNHHGNLVNSIVLFTK